MRQEIHWASERNVPAVTTQPASVWLIPGDAAPSLPFSPQHGRNAWLLDVGHDWRMFGGCLRLSLGGGHKAAWILCEFDSKEQST